MSTCPVLSVVVKTLNEEAHIGRTLGCIIAAIDGVESEIIVADSLSTDRTVEIAREFGVRVVQLLDPAHRSCGAGAQLGYQFSRGDFVLLLDGDMDLHRDFVFAAINALKSDPMLAGVGGRVVDVNFQNIEFRARRHRPASDTQPGAVKCLSGGGLFRRAAIESICYLTNRNLHSFEELEQGLRFEAAGWRLMRLEEVAVHHYGHTVSTLQMLKSRWRSRYLWGSGELLRAVVGKSYFRSALVEVRVQVTAMMWLLALAALCVLALTDWRFLWVACALVILPSTLMILKKRALALALYSIASWVPAGLGTARGILSSQSDPRVPLPAIEFSAPGSGGRSP